MMNKTKIHQLNWWLTLISKVCREKSYLTVFTVLSKAISGMQILAYICIVYMHYAYIFAGLKIFLKIFIIYDAGSAMDLIVNK